MRLDRLLPWPTPVPQPGRKDDRPPRRQPEPPEASAHRAAPETPVEEPASAERRTPPDHLDIIV